MVKSFESIGDPVVAGSDTKNVPQSQPDRSELPKKTKKKVRVVLPSDQKEVVVVVTKRVLRSHARTEKQTDEVKAEFSEDEGPKTTNNKPVQKKKATSPKKLKESIKPKTRTKEEEEPITDKAKSKGRAPQQVKVKLVETTTAPVRKSSRLQEIERRKQRMMLPECIILE